MNATNGHGWRRNGILAGSVVLGLALAPAALGREPTLTQSFSASLPVAVRTPGETTFTETWNVQKWNDPLQPLVGVHYELTVSLTYQGVVISPLASQDFQIWLRGDFDLSGLVGTPSSTLELQPTLLVSRKTGDADVPFVVGDFGDTVLVSPDAVGTTDATTATHLGAGTIPITITGALLMSGPGGLFSNNTSSGSPTEAVFSDNGKVRPIEGSQAYGITANLIVTYQVPEADAVYPLAALVGISGVFLALRRTCRAGETTTGR